MKCPDCEKELTEVLVLKHLVKSFRIDEEKKTLTQVYPNEEWDEEEWEAFCPNCNGDGVDALLSDYELEAV